MGIRRHNNYLFCLADFLLAMQIEQVIEAAEIIWKAQAFGNHVFICGNGGSAATASHFAEDIQKAAAVRAICLNDSIALLTAHGNDNGYDKVFAEQLKILGESGDLLCIFSGSGNSANVIAAAEMAHLLGMEVVFFGGGNGGKMKALADYNIIAPTVNMQWIEDIHLALAHAIYVELRKRRKEEEDGDQPQVR